MNRKRFLQALGFSGLGIAAGGAAPGFFDEDAEAGPAPLITDPLPPPVPELTPSRLYAPSLLAMSATCMVYPAMGYTSAVSTAGVYTHNGLAYFPGGVVPVDDEPPPVPGS